MSVRKAVFPAAGLGTRFLPATKAQPKEMLPLVDKPAIQYVVEESVASGPCMRQLLDVYEKYDGPVIAVERVPRERIHQYGVIAGRHITGNVWEISDLVEKPKAEDAPSDLAIIGRYVLTPDLFPILAATAADKRGEIQLTDGLRTLRTQRPMYAVEFEGKRYDTGDKLGFLKATVEFALSRPDLAEAFRAYLKTLDL